MCSPSLVRRISKSTVNTHLSNSYATLIIESATRGTAVLERRRTARGSTYTILRREGHGPVSTSGSGFIETVGMEAVMTVPSERRVPSMSEVEGAPCRRQPW